MHFLPPFQVQYTLVMVCWSTQDFWSLSGAFLWIWREFSNVTAAVVLFPWWLQHIHLIPANLLLVWVMVLFMQSSHRIHSQNGVVWALRITELYWLIPQVLHWIVSHLKILVCLPLAQIVKTVKLSSLSLLVSQMLKGKDTFFLLISCLLLRPARFLDFWPMIHL